jgi:leader peptidase (prepilin peptidase)/N-methyltransferase
MPAPIIIACGGVLGAIAGSYLATVLLRWPQGIGATKGRSRCDSCAAPLPVQSLVPILSYLCQRGRCRKCGAVIAPDHLLVELAAALVGAVSAGLFGDAPQLAIAAALFGWVLLLLAALDIRHFWLPDRLTLPLAALGLLVQLRGLGPGVAPALIGIVAGYGSLAGVAWAYRRLRGHAGLGGGDPRMFGAIGAWLGWQLLPWVLVIAAALGLAVVLVIAIGRRDIDCTMRLPLGTLMALAAWPLWLADRLV